MTSIDRFRNLLMITLKSICVVFFVVMTIPANCMTTNIGHVASSSTNLNAAINIDDDNAVEIVNNVLDRSEKVVNETKDFIGWQITKICIWIATIVIIGGLILLGIKIASQPKSSRNRAQRRRVRSTRRYS